MLGIKATENFVGKGMLFELGATYTIDKLEMSKHGFHFCEDIQNVLPHWLVTPRTKFLLVEALGKVIDQVEKCGTKRFATDRLKIHRELYPSELGEFCQISGDYTLCSKLGRGHKYTKQGNRSVDEKGTNYGHFSRKFFRGKLPVSNVNRSLHKGIVSIEQYDYSFTNPLSFELNRIFRHNYTLSESIYPPQISDDEVPELIGEGEFRPDGTLIRYTDSTGRTFFYDEYQRMTRGTAKQLQKEYDKWGRLQRVYATGEMLHTYDLPEINVEF